MAQEKDGLDSDDYKKLIPKKKRLNKEETATAIQGASGLSFIGPEEDLSSSRVILAMLKSGPEILEYENEALQNGGEIVSGLYAYDVEELNPNATRLPLLSAVPNC